jgi:hypothetical protein
MAWLENCLICNSGLCVEIDKRKQDGLTERAACKELSAESQGLYSEEALLSRYRYHTGKVKRLNPEVCEIHTGRQDFLELLKTRSHDYDYLNGFEYKKKESDFFSAIQKGLIDLEHEGDLIMESDIDDTEKMTGLNSLYDRSLKMQNEVAEYRIRWERIAGGIVKGWLKNGDAVSEMLFNCLPEFDFYEGGDRIRIQKPVSRKKMRDWDLAMQLINDRLAELKQAGNKQVP